MNNFKHLPVYRYIIEEKRIPKVKKINQYLLVDKLGSGRFSKVYLALDEENKNNSKDEYIAAKSVHVHDNCRSSMNLEREIKTFRSLSHPYIVKFHSVLYAPSTDTAYIMMEWANCGTLQQAIINSTNFDDQSIASIFIQIALALEYLHSKDIIHRDIKPSNILLFSDGTAKLSDFGISHSAESAESVCGTPSYQSPDLFEDICPLFDSVNCEGTESFGIKSGNENESNNDRSILNEPKSSNEENGCNEENKNKNDSSCKENESSKNCYTKKSNEKEKAAVDDTNENTNYSSEEEINEIESPKNNNARRSDEKDSTIANGVLKGKNVNDSKRSKQNSITSSDSKNGSSKARHSVNLNVKRKKSSMLKKNSLSLEMLNETNAFKCEIENEVSKIDARKGDIWSLGITMYQTAFGILPYYGQNVYEIVNMIQNTPLKIPESKAKNFSPLLIDLIFKMLKKEPDERISISEVIQHPFFTQYQTNITEKKSEHDTNLIQLKDNKVMPKVLLNIKPFKPKENLESEVVKIDAIICPENYSFSKNNRSSFYLNNGYSFPVNNQ